MFNRVFSLAADDMAVYIGLFKLHYVHECLYWMIYGSSGML
jgi:hypothetical protein